ncbi:MAG: hypothetical protein NTZ05_19300 [Chloroflexi bacterium]|nr:hypothetical protein [Chloroflexota bacterium]
MQQQGVNEVLLELLAAEYRRHQGRPRSYVEMAQANADVLERHGLTPGAFLSALNLSLQWQAERLAVSGAPHDAAIAAYRWAAPYRPDAGAPADCRLAWDAFCAALAELYRSHHLDTPPGRLPRDEFRAALDRWTAKLGAA